MFVRTLPTKTCIGSMSDFGVAYQAARVAHAPQHTSVRPLRQVKVAYMVGFDHTSDDTSNFCSLLRQAGVNDVVLNPSMASSRWKEFVVPGEMSSDLSRKTEFLEYYVVLCNDGAALSNMKRFLPDAFVRELHAFASPAAKPAKTNQRVMVVNLQWLFDSVTCGVILPANTKSTTNRSTNTASDEQGTLCCYKPNNERASKLWQITK